MIFLFTNSPYITFQKVIVLLVEGGGGEYTNNQIQSKYVAGSLGLPILKKRMEQKKHIEGIIGVEYGIFTLSDCNSGYYIFFINPEVFLKRIVLIE